ncbi:MAG: restriction endonuclease subunit S, partial [Thermoplasmata archaeon]
PLMINDNNVVPVYGANGVMGYTSKFLVDNDFTLVIGRVGASGEVHIGNGKIWISDNAIYSESYDKSKVYLPLLFYLLKFKNLSKFATKSTHPIITQSFLNSINLPLPPLPEQKAIAKVLSTVDEAIQKCNELIAKTERLKQGLMRELLTKGIGHKEFKDTEIGRIPKEWEVVKLEEAVKINRESIDPTRFPDDEFLYVDIESVENNTGVICDAKKIRGKEAPLRARRVLHYNDVIMSTVRPYLKAFAIIPKELDNQICSTGFAVLSCGEEVVPRYLLYTIFSDMVINQCTRMMVGGQYPALNESQVAEIKVPLPPLLEQQKIAEILSTIDKKLELERKRKEKLERIKKGLMNDLLTGKRRIPKEMWEKIGGE